MTSSISVTDVGSGVYKIKRYVEVETKRGDTVEIIGTETNMTRNDVISQQDAITQRHLALTEKHDELTGILAEIDKL